MEDETRNQSPEPENLETGKETPVGVDLIMSNGDSGPPKSVRLSAAILMQIISIVVGATVAVVSVQAKVEHVITDHDREAATSAQILRRVTELDAKVDYLTEELRYIRAKTDRIAEKEK